MKIKVFILLGIFPFSIGYGQSTKERDFTITVRKVVTALNHRDSTSLVKYIDRKFGVTVLYRIGVYDRYIKTHTLGFSDSSYPNAPFYDDVRLTTLKYSKLPVFNCIKWSKTGCFVDTSRVDHLLSKTAKWMKREDKKTVSEKTIVEFINLENNSRRIVIAANDDKELIFYLTYVNNKWVLTIIDKVTCDCSV